MRLLTAICLAALVVCFAVPAFAETQNIKVSGDVAVGYVYQNNIDLESNNNGSNQNFFINQVGLNVEADLTDNVSSYVRILNERSWDAEDDGTTATTTDQFEILLDEAYITLKEMLYAPLTLKIGRQNIWLGKGFVMGNAGPNVWDEGGLPSTIRELSDMTAFDSIRATLDYDPWTIDLIYAKIDENINTISGENGDDVDLYVANIGYDFTKYDAESELYYILKHDRAGVPSNVSKIDGEYIHTIGLRGSFVPFENMNVWAEGAYQFGTYRNTTRKADRSAGAINAGLDYVFADVRWTPKLGGEFYWLTGEKVDQTGDWKAWDPLYRGKFDTYYADFRNITKLPNDGIRLAGSDNGMTNQIEAAVIGGLSPMTDVAIDARWSIFWYDEVPVAGRSDEIGHELDAKVTYDYTEDVAFNVAAGVFWPLEYYPSNSDSTAAQILATTKVEF